MFSFRSHCWNNVFSLPRGSQPDRLDAHRRPAKTRLDRRHRRARVAPRRAGPPAVAGSRRGRRVCPARAERTFDAGVRSRRTRREDERRHQRTELRSSFHCADIFPDAGVRSRRTPREDERRERRTELRFTSSHCDEPNCYSRPHQHRFHRADIFADQPAAERDFEAKRCRCPLRKLATFSTLQKWYVRRDSCRPAGRRLWPAGQRQPAIESKAADRVRQAKGLAFETRPRKRLLLVARAGRSRPRPGHCRFKLVWLDPAFQCATRCTSH